MSAGDALAAIKTRTEGHTPGPWEVDPHDSGPLASIVSTADDRIGGWVEVARSVGADAELIAAAPRLLAALEAVMESHPKQLGGTPNGSPADICGACPSYWPCPTVKAIEEALS